MSVRPFVPEDENGMMLLLLSSRGARASPKSGCAPAVSPPDRNTHSLLAVGPAFQLLCSCSHRPPDPCPHSSLFYTLSPRDSRVLASSVPPCTPVATSKRSQSANQARPQPNKYPSRVNDAERQTDSFRHLTNSCKRREDLFQCSPRCRVPFQGLHMSFYRTTRSEAAAATSGCTIWLQLPSSSI